MHGDASTEIKYEDSQGIIFSRDQYIKALEDNVEILTLLKGIMNLKILYL